MHDVLQNYERCVIAACQEDLKTVSKYLHDLNQSDLESLGLALGLYLTTMDNYCSVTVARFHRYLIHDCKSCKR